MINSISRVLRRALPLAMAVMSLICCKNEDLPTEDSMQIVVSIVSKSDSEIIASFVPYDEQKEYSVGIVKADKGQESYDPAGEITRTGSQTVTFSELTQQTEYIVYARHQDKIVSQAKAETSASEPEDYALSLEISEVTSDKVSYSIGSNRPDKMYFADCVRKSDYDSWTEGPIEANKALMRSAIDILNQQGYNVTPSYFMQKGNTEDTIGNLSSETEYVLFAFGMDEDYTTTAPLVTKTFTTAKYEITDDCTFALSVESTTAEDIVLKVTPGSTDTRYYVGIAAYQSVKDYTPEEAAAALISYENQIGSDWKTLPCVKSGEASLSIVKDLGYNPLMGSSRYGIYVFGVDDNGKRTTTVASAYARTADPTPKDLTLKIDLKSISSVGALIEFVPSDDSTAFFTDVMTAEQFDQFSSEQEIQHYVVDILGTSINNYLASGVHDVDCDGMLVSGTEYVAYGFGFTDGVTTKLYTMRFRTNTITTGSDAAVAVEYQVMDGDSFGYKGESVLYLQFTPNSTARSWRIFVTNSDLSKYSEKELIDILNLNGMKDEGKIAYHLPWGTTVNVLTVAYDHKGVAGPVSIKTITTERARQTEQISTESISTIKEMSTASNLRTTWRPLINTLDSSQLDIAPLSIDFVREIVVFPDICADVAASSGD